MSIQTRLQALITQLGTDYKELKGLSTPGAYQTLSLTASGMATRSGYRDPAVRLEDVDCVRFRGAASCSSAVAAGATLFTLPVGYRPSSAVALVTNSGASGTNTLLIATTGVVTTQQGISASTNLSMDHLAFSL